MNAIKIGIMLSLESVSLMIIFHSYADDFSDSYSDDDYDYDYDPDPDSGL